MTVTFSDRTLRSYFNSLPDIFVLPPTSVIFAMHFVLFGDQRLEGMVDFYDQIVPADDTLEFYIIEDATTRDLSGAAYAHHLLFPRDYLISVPGVLDLFSWDDGVHLYLPLYSTVEAAVAAMSALFDVVLLNLLTVPADCRFSIADMVGLDTITWAETPSDTAIQEWLNSAVPQINREADRVNAWVTTPNVPLSGRIHMSRPTMDGILLVTDYRALPDGYTPGRRQCHRWARVLASHLDQFVDDHHRN